jgi:hypothetical protein
MTRLSLSFEKVSEKTDILTTIAQRRNRQSRGRDSIVKILTESTLAHATLEIPVGRREDADVHRFRSGGAHRAHLLAVEESQQLDLEGWIEVAHFVQEKGPAVRCDHQTLARSIGPGVSPFDGSEKLRLEQVAWNRCDVHRHQRALSAGQMMEGPGRDLLADSGLPLEKNR